MSSEIRTRFAPSPTGFLHVGGARTALFNYLYAKAKGGKFLLRIEDTDQDRSTEESFKTILESLDWLGIHHDEGPGVGGAYGPYVQSERIGIYKEHTEKLLQSNQAYRCFCTVEDLEAKKKQSEAMSVAYVYDGTCSNLTEKEIQTKLDAKLPYSIRFRTPQKQVIVDDAIQGKVKFDTKLIGDYIIVKSDGFPSYNYAVVVDDALMKITHVIRGVGHLSNTPRQIVIYEALGAPIPKFAHVSEIVGSDGKKLSKRAGATSVLAFRDLGYSQECFVNYMALLGWTANDGREYLPGELESLFDIERCSKSPATFDVFKKMKEEEKEKVDFKLLSPKELATYMNPKSKLNWLSNKYIRDLPLERVAKDLIPFLEEDPGIPAEFAKLNNPQFLQMVDSIRVYLDRLSDAVPYIAEFFVENISFESPEVLQLVLDGNGPKVVAEFTKILSSSQLNSSEDVTKLMDETGKATGEKGKTLFMPIRAITTGKAHGLELMYLFPLLGKEKLLQRVQHLTKEAKI